MLNTGSKVKQRHGNNPPAQSKWNDVIGMLVIADGIVDILKMYAPEIGELGLDMQVTYTRDEVYGVKSDVSIKGDVPPTYMPEDNSYRVVHIVKG